MKPKPAEAKSDAKLIPGSSFQDKQRIMFGLPNTLTFSQATESASALYAKVSVVPTKGAAVTLIDEATGRKYRVPLAERAFTFTVPLNWRDHALVEEEALDAPPAA